MACIVKVFSVNEIKPKVYLLLDDSKSRNLPNFVEINTNPRSTIVNILSFIKTYQIIDHNDQLLDRVFGGKQVILDEIVESALFNPQTNSQTITRIHIWHLSPQDLSTIKKYHKHFAK